LIALEAAHREDYIIADVEGFRRAAVCLRSGYRVREVGDDDFLSTAINSESYVA
jgi:hypothetical protein